MDDLEIRKDRAAGRITLTRPALAERKPEDPRALILAPTRELAIQIHKDAVKFGSQLGLKFALVYGGVDYDKQRQMLQDLGREPTPQELAKEMDITEEKVLEIQQYAREPISLDQTIGDEGDSQLGDFIEDSEAVIAVDAVSFTLLQDQLQDVLTTLSEREAGVVRLRFGLTDGMPRTLDEIGQVYGVTRERIRQIESKTMSKLRHPSRSQVLRDYLD